MRKQLFTIAFGFFVTSSFAQILETLPPSYRENQSNPMEIFRAEAEKINSLVHTKLDLKFDYQKEQVYGEAWITLKPHFYDTNKLTLDAKAMLIHEVSLVSGTTKKPLKFSNDDYQLYVDLDKTYKRTQEYTVYIKYTARPNEVKQQGSAAITAAKGMYFINANGENPNKPIQIWTQGETESSSCWFPTIDKPNQKTSQEMYLTVPEKYATLSNGELKKQTKNSDGTRTDYWKFDQKHAPYLFFVGIGDYAIIKDKWKNVDVHYYVEHEYAPYAKQIFGNTPEMIGFFSDKLNYQFPWNKYHQITARDYISGAMENTTAVIFYDKVQQKPGELIDENNAESIIAHELFHHWFGDLVTTESWGNLTVNESLANYSEYLWFEHKFGRDKAEEDRYDDLLSYHMNPSNFDKNLVRVHYHHREDMFDVISYNKGGKGVLHMLRNYLGDDAFFGGLSKYLHDYEYGTAEAVQLRLALEQVSGRDLNWFFDQWFFANGHPKFNIGYDYNANTKKVKITVVQTQPNLFEVPFTFDVVVDGKAQRHTTWISKKRENVFEFDASKKPEVVIPNSNQNILCEINDIKNTNEFAAQYKFGKDQYVTRLLAILKLKDAQSNDETALNTIISALDDPYEGLRIQAINALDETHPKVKSKSIDKLKKLATNDAKTLVQSAAISKLNQMREFDLQLLNKATQSNSYSVQAAAIEGILNISPERIVEFKDLDDKVLTKNPRIVGELTETWIKENQTKRLAAAAESYAFFIFTEFEDPKLGEKLKKGFEWMMSSDDLESVENTIKSYEQVINHYSKENPSLKSTFKALINKGLNLKTKTYQTSPNKSLEKQIELLSQFANNIK